MHELAEYGIAAHVIYKEGAKGKADSERQKMTWLRQLLEAEGEQDPKEFLESLKVDLFEDEVFVFTPRGEVKNLSGGSTPLDFAYAVHTDVGHSSGPATSSRSSPPSRSAVPRATGWRWSGQPGPGTRSARS
jgi:GTP pyrophosphokinase